MGMECLRSEAQAFFFWDGGDGWGFMRGFLGFVIEFISFMLEFQNICSFLHFIGLRSRIEVAY